MAAERRWYRCPDCGMVESRPAGIPIPPRCSDATKLCEPVVVLPVSRADALLRLVAVVGDQLFFADAPTQPDRSVLETAWRAARDGGTA